MLDLYIVEVIFFTVIKQSSLPIIGAKCETKNVSRSTPSGVNTFWINYNKPVANFFYQMAAWVLQLLFDEK